MTQALIIVDIQNDFLPGGALAVPEGDTIVPVVNDLMDKFDLVVATQDWHPAGHGSFAPTPERIGEVVDLNGLDQILWPVHCVQQTAGAEFAPGLNMDGIDVVVQKGTDMGIDSYSGFFDNGKRKATELQTVLDMNNVQQVYVVGLATDYCVKFTALDAAEIGYQVTLITDAARGVNLNPGDVDKAVQDMRDAGVAVTEAGTILNADRAGVR